MAYGSSNRNDVEAARSPFFHPSLARSHPHYVVVQQRTPSQRHVVRSVVAAPDNNNNNNTEVVTVEHKSTITGAVSNLVNAIVGCGIVGIPYAMKQAGFGAGIVLIFVTALLSEKSLRLLIATAKHIHTPSYETALEAVYGKWGFRFAAINMFIVAYGAMVSYCMMVKDSFSTVLGIDESDTARRRACLLTISLCIMVPIASQRDMADLAKTSRLSVVIDTFLVLLIAWNAPKLSDQYDSTASGIHHLLVDQPMIHFDTIFIGLGVLSFAFVCQHAAFVIAGSLENPTQSRWTTVTTTALLICAVLSFCCGMSGYIGYQQHTAGNILNNLETTSLSANVARFLLGCTMLLVYPLECFVARHVLVVFLFSGRAAHEGDDAAVLQRTDRRVLLTLFIYVITVTPAALMENMGTVFALTGAIGGSCLSYIGPGILYLGCHGTRFLELIEQSSWWNPITPYHKDKIHDKQHVFHPTIEDKPETLFAVEHTPLIKTGSTASLSEPTTITNSSSTLSGDHKHNSCVSVLLYLLRKVSWYITGMPIWCAIANAGQTGVDHHVHEMALQSPHPIRIGDVEYKRIAIADAMNSNNWMNHQQQQHANSNITTTDEDEEEESTEDDDDQQQLLPKSSKTNSKLSWSDRAATKAAVQNLNLSARAAGGGTGKINDFIGKELLEKQQQQQQKPKPISSSLEPDPQQEPPTWLDFYIAIIFIIFGAVALLAGLVSIHSDASG